MKVTLHWRSHKYFDYERRLAIREVEALLGPAGGQGLVEVALNGHPPEVIKRLTYFGDFELPTGYRGQTDQARLEASALSVRGGMHRQQTRYSLHGLHEYRGKFNPQVVRAIANCIGIEPGMRVVDPFCGSGTTLLEAAHIGWRALGIDINPLAVYVANAKIAALCAAPADLEADGHALRIRLSTKVLDYAEAWPAATTREVAGNRYQDLPNYDYLTRWFSTSVLAQLSFILDAIDAETRDGLRSFYRAILSDLLRSVSYQDPGDLRIRRRKTPLVNAPVIPRFLRAVAQQTDLATAARSVVGDVASKPLAVHADIRSWKLSSTHAPFDAAITSPPYFSALPYIDTQRLSLCALGLIDSKDIARLDAELIGSREIGSKRRDELESDLAENRAQLPLRTVRELRQLAERSRTETGFRRRRVGALGYQYFASMSQALHGIRSIVKPGGRLAMVVGPNRTTLGGVETVIDTPRLLADVAIASGWAVDEVVPLETFPRFDAHARNSIKAESLILLTRG